MEDLVLSNGAVIRASELRLSYSRSSGPGGQNVNKVNTKAMLRFAPASSGSLTPAQREAVVRALASSLTASGEIVVFSSRTRSRAMNAADAAAKLAGMLESALARRKRRVSTAPTRASGERRLLLKKIRGGRKRLRARPAEED